MLYVVLLHFPVYDKRGRVVTTSVANMDIHDIARAAKTYGAGAFYIVNPIAEQRRLAEEIVSHWQEGWGARYNPSRREALSLVRIKETLTEALEDIRKETGAKPITVATGANLTGDVLSFDELKSVIRQKPTPFAIIFGTGLGLAEAVFGASDYKLEPIRGRGTYNHLSVRSAVAVVLDRITH